MASDVPSYERTGWLEDLNSMLISASIHFTLFIALALLTVAGSGGKHGNSLMMTLGGDGTGPAAGPAMDDLASAGDPLADPSHLENSAELAAALGPANEFDTPSPLATEIAVPDAVAMVAAELGGAGGLAQKEKTEPMAMRLTPRRFLARSAEPGAAAVGLAMEPAPWGRLPRIFLESADMARRLCTWWMLRTA